MSLLTGLPSAICCFFTGINIPIKIDRCKSFMIYFQIFTTFRYKSLKNSDYVGWNLRLRLDHILYPKDFELCNVYIVDSDVSDHRALIADFKLNK